jgi:signal transduction histidine kinase
MGILTFFWKKEKKKGTITSEKEYQRLLSEELDKLSAEYLGNLGEMTTTLAHEIRNPLASIRAGAQRIEQKTVSIDPKIKGECLKYVQFIIREVDRLEGLVKNLLQDMRIFAQRQKPNCQLVDPNLLLEEIIFSLEDEMNKRGIKIVKTFFSPLPKMHLDPQLITQVFLNLIKNSFDALQNSQTVNKEIYFSTKLNQNYLEVKVTDTGPGIPQELKEKIFQPFVSSKQNGTGLGLAICQRIIEAHQGKIFLDSGSSSGESRGGATFVVRLPIKEGLA